MQLFRIIKYKVFFVSMIFILSFSANTYAGEGNRMEKDLVNLVAKFNLDGIDRIKIRGEDFDKEVKGKVFIVDKKPEIDKIVNSLRSVKSQPLCDCKPRFKLLLYNQGQFILDLGFQNYDDHYYLRYKNEEQFVPDKEFLEFLNNLIESK